MNVEEIYFNNTILDIKFVQLKSASQTGILHREIKDLNNTPLKMKKKKNQINIFHIEKKKKRRKNFENLQLLFIKWGWS